MHSALMRIRSGASSLDSTLVTARPAARVADVGKDCAGGTLAAVLGMFTIRPLPALRMAGRHRRMVRIAA